MFSIARPAKPSAAATTPDREGARERSRPSVSRRGRSGIATATAAVLALVGSAAVPAHAVPDVPEPLIHYAFDAPAGTTITDDSGNGNDAVLRQSGGAVEDGVLRLPGGARATAAYVELPAAPLVGKKDLTVSTWMSTASGPANTAAAFIGTPVAPGGSHSGSYWLLNPSNPSGYVKSVVTGSVNAGAPWSTEIGPGSTGAATSGARTPAGMALYTTVIDGTSGRLTVYINGSRISQHEISRDVSSFGPQLVASLGRSTYNDPSWRGEIDDFAVYASALDEAAVQLLFAGEALERAVASVHVPQTAAADFALPTTTYGAQVSWASDHPAIAVEGGAATVRLPAAGAGAATVTLTATFALGAQSRERTYRVTVPEDITAEEKAQRDADALEIPNEDDIRTDFSLTSSGGAYGSLVEWSVAAGGEAHVALGEGVREGALSAKVQRPAAGAAPVEVDITATVRNGSATKTRAFTVRIQPMPGGGDKTEAYFWAYFTGEGQGAERVSIAASKGNDALSWNTLNDGEPLFTSTVGTEGLRDPFIIRAPHGDRFFMIATDLKVAGLPGGFTTAQISGSRYIEVWESNDLVNWSQQRHVKVSSDFAGNTWAPEAFWSEELDTFVVFWASNLYDTPRAEDRTGVTYNRMMYATTDDFVTFSEPQIWIDVPRGSGRGMIDSTVAQVGDTYHRFTKDEADMTLRHETSTDLLATVTGSLPGPQGAADQWTLIKERVGTGLPNGEPGRTFTSGEGPSIFPANEGDVNGLEWFLFIDQPDYHGGPNYYIPFGTDDIDSGDAWQPLGAKLRENLPQNADGGKPRHGTILPVTRAEYQKVLEAYAPHIAVTSIGSLAVTTTAGIAPTLPRADLTKADGSRETVEVVWEEIPASAYAQPGTFTVRGTAQDDSRMPVEAAVTVEGTLDVAVTATTRCLTGKVLLTVTVSNRSDASAEMAISTAHGDKTVVVAPGRSASYAVSTRLGSIEAGEVTVAAQAGDESRTVSAAYSARSCG